MSGRAVPSSDNTATGAADRQTRARLHPAQKLLLVAAAGVIVGSFLPWVSLNMGATFGGFAGAGLYTFYVGAIGVGGGLVPVRNLAIVQGLIVGLVAVGLPVWQIVRLLRLVGLSGWFPGTGLIVVLASGCLALLATYRIWRDDPGI